MDNSTPAHPADEERQTLEQLFESIERQRDLRGTATIADIVSAVREDREPHGGGQRDRGTT